MGSTVDYELERFTERIAKIMSLWLTHEVVVPGDLARNHEEAQEAVREQHLDPLIVGRQVALGVVALVRVLSAPLVSAGRQLVGGQRARARSEADET